MRKNRDLSRFECIRKMGGGKLLKCFQSYLDELIVVLILNSVGFSKNINKIINFTYQHGKIVQVYYI